MSGKVRAKIMLEINVDPFSTLVHEKDPDLEFTIYTDGEKEIVSPATLLHLMYIVTGIAESHVEMMQKEEGANETAITALSTLVSNADNIREKARERADRGELDLTIKEDYQQKTGTLPVFKQANILIQPDGSISNIPEPDDAVVGYTLKQLQGYVNGLIEVVPFENKEGRVAIVNEEGLLTNQPYNAHASQLIGQDLVGPVLVIKEGQLK